MAKQYRQLDSGLMVPYWMPDMRPRRRIGSPKEFMFTPSGACGCDCETCTIFADDFSTDDLSANWTQQSGTWSIGSGVLSTSSSNAILTCNTSYPGGGFHNHVIQVSLKASTGNSSRVIFSFDSDTGEYNYLEVYWNTSGGSASIKKSDGTTVVTASNLSFNNSSWYSWKICVTSEWASVLLPVYYYLGSYMSGPVTSSTTTVGLGTGSTSASLSFDSFSFQRHASEMTGCPTCVTCSICTGTPPETLYVTLPTITAGGCLTCAALSGQTFVTRWYAQCVWVYVFSGSPCHGKYLTVDLVGSQIYVNLTDNIVTPAHFSWYRASLPGSYDCSSMDITTNGYAGSDGQCNTSGHARVHAQP